MTNLLDRIMHVALAIPATHKNNLTLTISARLQAKLEQKAAPNLVQPSGRTGGSDAGSDAGSARGRAVENEEPRQPVEDLV